LQKTLIFLEYLETGLIPVSGFHKDGNRYDIKMALDRHELNEVDIKTTKEKNK
jgi:hypothetical protein